MAPTIFAFDKEQTKYVLQHYEGDGGGRRGTNPIREQLLPRIPPRRRLMALNHRRTAFARLLNKYIHIFPAPVATANHSESEDDDDEPEAYDEHIIVHQIAHPSPFYVEVKVNELLLL